ncbi:hypothetical protein LPW11_19760 [Geomonas sp. RF6]|uniref:hypothetical protein n=1 Tax=Geomonas sp. RF6 TaxID=2897342 RepID=UPI001E5137C9|nr:hypothetical protein [Geomonas sp. RF6]UFS70098.1 hypothetical protein LPW11_19760 [Geomonas sp. RF6]
MTRKTRTCVDCHSHAVSHTVERQSRYLVSEKIIFSCGSVQEEIFDSEGSIGSVEFNGSCGGV